MSLADFVAPKPCPLCGGSGTCWTADATTPGRVFADVCSRCRGVGTVLPAFADEQRPPEPACPTPRCPFHRGHAGRCYDPTKDEELTDDD